MKKALVAFAVLLAGTAGFAQRPSNPALLIPQSAPDLDYMAVADPVTLTAGAMMISFFPFPSRSAQVTRCAVGTASTKYHFHSSFGSA